MLALLLCLASVQAFSADRKITTLEAIYDLLRDNKQVGETRLTVARHEDRLHWQSITTAMGFYAWLTDKQPYAESIQHRIRDDFYLSSIQISASMKEPPEEVASFDWHQSLMTSTRKGKQNQQPLSDHVYDHLSIHWLAAQMRLTNVEHCQLTFYRKGRLIQSTLVKTANEWLIVGNKTVQTTVFEQSFESLNHRFTYHYSHENPWLPLRIKLERKDRKTILMRLKSF